MNILINVLLAIDMLVAVLMALVILMQRPKSEGLGAAFGGGVTENIFGAQTTNVLARVFVARDQIDSYVDPKTLLPFRTVLKLIEGRRRLSQTVTLNQDAGAAVIDTGFKIDVPVGTHDYLSFFYAVRTLNLTPGKRNAVSMLVENKPKTVFVASQKREAITLGERVVPAIALSITTDDADLDKFQFRLWISDDKRRLPLRIACVTQLGPLRADLAILPAASQ